MRIALFGRTGQVATEVQRRLPEGATLEVLGREEADFGQPGQVAEAARKLRADAVINAVAYTAVDRAETETELAEAVNGGSVTALAGVCADMGLPLVHISTDYVFTGDGTQAWRPGDPTGPLGAYGRSKLAGEEGIRTSGARHAILRTSWVFSAHGANFVKTMLRLGAEREELRIVADQVGGPTPAADIADACLTLARGLAEGREGGTFHFSGQPDASWADFAREIFAQAGLPTRVIDIPTSDYPTPARRPLNSRMDCSTLEVAFGIARPDWRAGLREVLAELGAAR
ncbi:dTDP-4-dehydrorhamnose reductase [Histidinibacterium lentulum]|uniref:dTDP-4-dehydrorhamnose reductase n=1 Tax=Histidinibacterium lentulum TaxID=2480588 RepID=A0A3N2R682_9RHOB|nr:dTDP-4-dehydrorhamnose reductase [Histidinibacterium lentulum]ROU02979.1 dTDP-4-dehydrorhamnose reductase [Histidinibacterium lentulum]